MPCIWQGIIVVEVVDGVGLGGDVVGCNLRSIVLKDAACMGFK
jgi:hypothetical protein